MSAQVGESIELYGIRMPAALVDIAGAIECSRWILELDEDWDDEGGKPYSEAAWKQAVEFYACIATRLWDDRGVRVAIPRILPGPDGAIDLHWKTPRLELLVSIPETDAEPIRFYGDDGSGGLPIKGEMALSPPSEWLLLWIAERESSQ